MALPTAAPPAAAIATSGDEASMEIMNCARVVVDGTGVVWSASALRDDRLTTADDDDDDNANADVASLSSSSRASDDTSVTKALLREGTTPRRVCTATSAGTLLPKASYSESVQSTYPPRSTE